MKTRIWLYWKGVTGGSGRFEIAIVDSQDQPAIDKAKAGAERMAIFQKQRYPFCSYSVKTETLEDDRS